MFSHTSSDRTAVFHIIYHALGILPSPETKDKTRMCHSLVGALWHGAMQAMLDEYQNMGPSKSYYVTALPSLLSLNFCKSMNGKLIGKKFRSAGYMGPVHPLGIASRLVGCIWAHERAPIYGCSLFSTFHHVRRPLHIHIAVQLCFHFQRFLGILQT